METRIKILSLAALLFSTTGAGVLDSTPAAAEDVFSSWDSVANQALSEERGKAFEIDESALATAVGAQYQHVTFDGLGAVGPGGAIDLGSNTFADQVMSLNVINTGSNVALQNKNVVAVTVIDSTLGVP